MTAADAATRISEAGVGLAAAPKFMAQMTAIIDEHIVEVASGDPTQALRAMVEIGLAKTVALITGTTPVTDAETTWAHVDREQKAQRARLVAATPLTPDDHEETP